MELALSAADAIQPALEHAKQQLLRPFRFAQWARLAFVGFLAGEMGSFGGCNGNFNVPSHANRGPAHFGATGLPPYLAQHPGRFVGLIIFSVVIGAGLIVLFIYIASVMRFILFDSIIARECQVRQGWARRKSEGLRLFRWQLLLMVVSFSTVLVLIGIPLLCAWALDWFMHPREHLAAILVVGGILLSLFLAVMVLLAVVNVMTKDFVVPQMAFEEIGAMEGWRRLWLQLKREKGGFAGYIGMKIVLAIGAAIVFGIVTIIAIFVLLIPIGGIAAGAVVAGMASGLTWNTFTIGLAVIYGCVALAILVFAGSLISVPTIVFFPAYSIYFFAPRFPPLAALVSLQPTDPTTPALPWQEPPPSPPAST